MGEKRYEPPEVTRRATIGGLAGVAGATGMTETAMAGSVVNIDPDRHEIGHGRSRGKGHENGRGEGHKKGRGKGHQKSNGNDHEKGSGSGHD